MATRLMPTLLIAILFMLTALDFIATAFGFRATRGIAAVRT
jgi:hypothetical protein